ncbi:MAG: sensor histidine kinase [Lachnospiraceae bacterium]|nr:sensor histidine kinase [Lachnospiraceae bacterium]
MTQKIKNSLLLQLICIVLAILAVLSVTLYASYFYVRQTTHNYVEALSDSLLKQADNALGQYRENLRYNAEMLCRPFSKDDINTFTGEELEEQIASDYYQLTLENREVSSMILFDSGMNAVLTLGKPVTLPERQAYLRSWEAFNADHYYSDSNSSFYGFYYPIYSRIDEQAGQRGMCVFILEPWRIDGVLHNIMFNNTSAMLLSDPRNSDLSFYTFGNVPPDTSMDELKQNKDFVYREGNWQNGIRIAIAVSVSENTSGSEAIVKLIIFASALSLLFLAVIIFFSYYQMAKPIRVIAMFIDNSITHPERRLRLERTDEIGTVAASLDHMLDDNQRMIEEIKDSKIRLYETQLAQQKMEILAYRNQINPHFLYNTLSCMRDMALINDQDSIAEMAMALSDIFRYAVKASNIVTVRDEISYIEKYSKIIDYRFMGRIKITSDADPEVLDKPMIRFLLQPLVENSVFHGLERKMGEGFVRVLVSENDNRIELKVEDNGCGMDEDTLKKLNEQFENQKESNGIGMSNIVQRLRLFYGDDYTFRAQSVVDEGTVIWMSVPDHMKEI